MTKICCVVFSAVKPSGRIDNDYIITSSEDNNVVFYNLIDPDKNYTLKGHTKASTSVDTNPVNSGTIVSCGFDGRIIVWDSN